MRYKEPLVQNNPKGSQFLWRDVIADANSTGLLDIQLNSQVESLQWRSGWEAMLTNGRRVSGYEDIILATLGAE
ncbi:Methyltransferase-like protein 24 [Durusdinium trenchii]|uniref:Methyltransferase-like protein 24 n=1 Tax=Durusdinium trenchii TaxID=1381693 RepID=A0ABP0P6M4_9DINO